MTTTTTAPTGTTNPPAAESSAPPAIPSAYEKALAELEQTRAGLIALKPVFDLAERVVAQFPALEARIHGSISRVWIDVNADSLAPVQPLLAAIVRSGYHPLGRTDYTDESSPRVTYDYGRSRVGIGQMIVNIYLSRSGGCTFEKVGEKMVPILRIVCHEGSEVAA